LSPIDKTIRTVTAKGSRRAIQAGAIGDAD